MVHSFVWRLTSGRTKISLKSGRGLGHVTNTIFGSTVGYPSDSLASCFLCRPEHTDYDCVLGELNVFRI